ncbi:MAG: hypothetical protein QXV17_14955 [Candidatus Micrarchaeaceae archaeon]
MGKIVIVLRKQIKLLKIYNKGMTLSIDPKIYDEFGECWREKGIIINT